MNIVKVSHLSKIYRQPRKPSGLREAWKGLLNNEMVYKKAVDDISFNIECGDIVGLLGPNGAGKTTILKMLAGILYPTSGEIVVDGYIPYERKDEYKKCIAMVTGQRNQMFWDLPAIDTYEWLRVIYGLDKQTFKKNLDLLIELFHVDDLLEVQVKKMSLGQRMKMEFIAAMIHCPKVVFLDEPTIGLDVTAQSELRNYIKRYNKERNATIILTSHNLFDVQELCNNIILINHGHITQNTSLQKLIRDYCDYKLITLYHQGREMELKTLAEGMTVIRCSMNETVIKVKLENLELGIKYLWSNYVFDDMNIADANIHQIIEKAFCELE